MSETALNEDVLGISVSDLERGFILHIIQIYPAIAIDIKFPSATELYFTFKPIFDLLAFTTIRLLRESITEKLLEEFMRFCTTSLSRDAIEFVKEKLFAYVGLETISQPNRAKVYEVIGGLDFLLEEGMHTDEGQGINIKKKKASSSTSTNQTPKKKTPVNIVSNDIIEKKTKTNQKVVEKKKATAKPSFSDEFSNGGKVKVLETKDSNNGVHQTKKKNSKDLSKIGRGLAVQQDMEEEETKEVHANGNHKSFCTIA